MKKAWASFLYLNLMFLVSSALFAGDNTSVQLFFTGDVYGYLKKCG